MTTEEYNKNYSTKSSLSGTLEGSKDAPQKPKVQKVVKGAVSTKKKSLKDKFLDTFVTEDMASVKENIISNVIMGLKSFALDSLEMIMFGDYTGYSRRRFGSGANRNYNAISSTRSRSSLEAPLRKPVALSATQQMDDILLETRSDAEMVLDQLSELIEQYGQATIADLYELVGKSRDIEHTDYKYGWTDISRSQIVKLRGEGYLLRMSRPGLVD